MGFTVTLYTFAKIKHLKRTRVFNLYLFINGLRHYDHPTLVGTSHYERVVFVVYKEDQILK